MTGEPQTATKCPCGRPYRIGLCECGELHVASIKANNRHTRYQKICERLAAWDYEDPLNFLEAMVAEAKDACLSSSARKGHQFTPTELKAIDDALPRMWPEHFPAHDDLERVARMVLDPMIDWGPLKKAARAALARLSEVSQ